MDFGVTGKLGGYYLAEQYRKNAAANKNGGVSFAELAAVKAVGKSDVSVSFRKNFSRGKSFLSHAPCDIAEPSITW